jgi:hypothetical protein
MISRRRKCDKQQFKKYHSSKMRKETFDSIRTVSQHYTLYVNYCANFNESTIYASIF